MRTTNGLHLEAYRPSALRCAALLAGVMLLAPITSADEVRVTGTRVNVRQQPTTNSAVLFQVMKGDTLHLVERAQGWYLVQAPDGRRGYIHGDLADPIELRQEKAASPPNLSTSSPALRPVPTEEFQESIEEARERSWSEKRRRKALYKIVGGAAGVATGLVVMSSSKPAGIGLVGAGGYFLWDGYGDRREEAKRMRWTVLLQLGRDEAGVAYHMSW